MGLSKYIHTWIRTLTKESIFPRSLVNCLDCRNLHTYTMEGPTGPDNVHSGEIRVLWRCDGFHAMSGCPQMMNCPTAIEEHLEEVGCDEVENTLEGR
ncbi:hypothetical protein SCLCIDRAFT_256144 [Scleroderma citrinum Foug A]|uniref:Uncharacterized protein n=1 Tax=Scleroderma citrinum Foug A TaxID=1036808 RepID=A0A0C2ZZH6_9AGAM|nr:hypothetical protein SCLCIDRAFT_256144 [Scleroderma citrinum Foug A]